MRIIEAAIRHPVSTTVGVLLVVLFGMIALFGIPVQLTPSVEQPTVTVSTIWPGASPREVEREIVQEQEEVLKSLDGLLEMESTSQQGSASVTLLFRVGSDPDTNLLKVSNRLQQVPSYPADAEKPVLRSVDQFANAMAWFVIVPGGDEPIEGDLSVFHDFLDDEVKPAIERINGVAAVNLFGGREREIHVIIDPEELAARRITWSQVANSLAVENRSISGGDFAEGKRRYIVRTVGELAQLEDIDGVVLGMSEGVPVRLEDVGRAEIGYTKARAQCYSNGKSMIASAIIKEPGANVIESMAAVRDTVEILNQELLRDRGLEMQLAYDETEYIVEAISLVKQSLVIGGILAVIVLLTFLRSPASTLVIGIAIPISVIGTFLLMSIFGRTINVVSLAGMAFAVGMVVDSAIVVLENIYRHRQMGKEPFAAALDGAVEVWGAVLASTLTTIAVFIPVVFIEEEAGQLFRDIAIAISCAVGLSLIVAMTVIPSLSARLLVRVEAKHEDIPDSGFGTAFCELISSAVRRICGSTTARLTVVIGLTVVSVGLSALLLPQAEYLPQGNQNFLFGLVFPPPGYNIDEVAEIGQHYADELEPLWTTPDEEAAEISGGGIDNFFFVALNQQAFMGARARHSNRVRELIQTFIGINSTIPGAFAFVDQMSIFSQGIGEGRNIDVDITGPELEQLIALGGEVFGKVNQLLPGAQARPIPSLDLGNPELVIRPDRRRSAELGLSTTELGFAVSALTDGAKVSEIRYEGDELDLEVRAEEGWRHRTHLFEQLPLATPSGQVVPLSAVATVSLEQGPVQILRRERQRAITIQVTPPTQVPLSEAMTIIEEQILAPMRDQGRLSGLYRARLAGSADKLTQTADALRWNLILALLITYLLMSALFESFVHPFVIMFSVPLAALGGVLGLAVLNLFTYQALDVLTMLAFIILIGTVVNNAILLVHQALNHLREGMSELDAITEATRNRIRPIFMSVLTSCFGMLPLVLFPGAGSELYRGLGSVVVGGLLVSTIFTLFLVPALFSLFLELGSKIGLTSSRV